ncbi:hypothetical protein GCM10011611_60520 [Aliidongia dinghuensis]|uniref:HTH marR-type domain-containing protein n=1 Tax=Aliidongia dinghuensis TaxID=1867774 RepID=A0A8J2Z1N0_9PROT|nr:MarR family winged helix-turn-helix transcriptional regulator [Aliidongia dinghuensis]GGF45941.1 hypothetical protein GCM10011611_60520 [Aliidongia dinghuensis]
MSAIDEPAESGPAPLGPGFMLWQVTNGWQRAVRAALAPTGLTYVQVVLLSGLKDKLAEGPTVSQAALAHALGADPMMTSQVLRTLETSGLVTRERNQADTRSRLLSLTAEGRKRLAAALPLVAAVDTEFFDVLGRREERFLKAMRRLWRKQRLAGLGPSPATAEAPAPEPAPEPAPTPTKTAPAKTAAAKTAPAKAPSSKAPPTKATTPKAAAAKATPAKAAEAKTAAAKATPAKTTAAKTTAAETPTKTTSAKTTGAKTAPAKTARRKTAASKPAAKAATTKTAAAKKKRPARQKTSPAA